MPSPSAWAVDARLCVARGRQELTRGAFVATTGASRSRAAAPSMGAESASKNTRTVTHAGRALRCGRAGRLDGLRGLVELLDAGGELEVAVGQPTLGVTGEGQGDLVPADVDIGVVAGRFGRCGDLGDEDHRLGEVLAHEGLDDLIAAPLPAGQV